MLSIARYAGIYRHAAGPCGFVHLVYGRFNVDNFGWPLRHDTITCTVTHIPWMMIWFKDTFINQLCVNCNSNGLTLCKQIRIL